MWLPLSRHISSASALRTKNGKTKCQSPLVRQSGEFPPVSATHGETFQCEKQQKKFVALKLSPLIHVNPSTGRSKTYPPTTYS
ncbi:hypothetical protein CEP54_015760 [Fusarium duplospermum]|uniref:Uncharacterized protein n=1 Tax=Fusarium duplospermum TaxID=1325734 RepID=A0A428NLG8_9HYPO|nr:hypothetical protein CEP54_015760 [Fusarium duplospermum]